VDVQPLFENGREQQPGRHRKNIVDEAPTDPVEQSEKAEGPVPQSVGERP
jgi:hypothetical protein